MIVWNNLTEMDQLETIIEESQEKPVLLFKHSTTCSISAMAKRHVDYQWNFEDDQVKPYYLDLLAHRDISYAIAVEFGVEHQSPQVLLIKEGKCVYNASHHAISVEAVGIAMS